MSIVQLIASSRTSEPVVSVVAAHLAKVYASVERVGDCALTAVDNYPAMSYVSRASIKVARVGDVWQVTVDHTHKMASGGLLFGVGLLLWFVLSERWGLAFICFLIAIVGPAFSAKRKEERIVKALEAAKSDLADR